MAEPFEPALTPLDFATDAIVRYVGAENDLGRPDLAEAVDAFTDQLQAVLESTVSTHAVIAAGARLAGEHRGPIAAGWLGYIAGIRAADEALGRLSESLVAEAEAIAGGG